MKVAVPVLAPILRSDTQGRLLAAILVAPEEEHTITALAAQAGTSLPTAIREIDRADTAQLITSRRLGNTRLVKANPTNPLYQPFQEIILATYGPPAVIADVFAAIKGIKHLYLFGSWAARYQGEPGRAPNDIDLLVVGTPNRNQVYEATDRAERRLGLPVQATIRSLSQWNAKDDPFIAEIRSRPLVSLRDELPS